MKLPDSNAPLYYLYCLHFDLSRLHHPYRPRLVSRARSFPPGKPLARETRPRPPTWQLKTMADASVSEKRLLVLYGSQTGTAQDTAERVGRNAKRRHFRARVLPMDNYDKVCLLSYTLTNTRTHTHTYTYHTHTLTYTRTHTHTHTPVMSHLRASCCLCLCDHRTRG